MNPNLHLGTCSWKYPGWAGTVRSAFAQPGDYLQVFLQGYYMPPVAEVYANNHFEGCAPLTLERLQARMAALSDQHRKTKVG